MNIQISLIILMLIIVFGRTNSSNIKSNEFVNFKLLVKNWNKTQYHKYVSFF